MTKYLEEGFSQEKPTHEPNDENSTFFLRYLEMI
jgi:hypothetical protein